MILGVTLFASPFKKIQTNRDSWEGGNGCLHACIKLSVENVDFLCIFLLARIQVCG